MTKKATETTTRRTTKQDNNNAATAATVYPENLLQIPENERPNLRRIAAGCEVNYNMLLRMSKSPVAGVPYDPSSVNWNAVNRYIVDKIGEERYLNMDWVELYSTTVQFAPKADINTFKVGTKLKIRGVEIIYEVLYINETHIVLLPNNDTTPRLFNHHTFLHQTPKIVTEEV